MLTLPLASVDTVTIFMPAMTALAGLVPWADTGMMQMSRWPSPLRGCVQVGEQLCGDGGRGGCKWWYWWHCVVAEVVVVVVVV